MNVSRGQRIAAEINCIRIAMKEQGYRIQKQPKQAVWVIYLNKDRSYRLTYQPAPINAWSLHPPDSEASRLLGIIQRALVNQPSSSGSGI